MAKMSMGNFLDDAGSTVDIEAFSLVSSSSDQNKDICSSSEAIPYKINWTARHVEKLLNIYYEREYLESPLEVLRKISNFEELTVEQKSYLDQIKTYLKFNASYVKFDETYNFYTVEGGLKRTLQEVVVDLSKEPGKDELIKFKVSRFLKNLHRFMISMESCRSQYQVYEGYFLQLLGSFAEMCCVEVMEGSKSKQSVWKNLAGTTTIVSKPDLRFYKSGLTDYEYFGNSKVVASLIEVKQTSDKLEQRLEHLSSCSNDSKRSGKSEGAEQSQIELDLNKRVLGQHALELLLDLDNFCVKRTMFAAEDYTMTMPGIILKGTQVFFTMLKMERSHHRKLKYNDNLDPKRDKAIIYYCKPLDLLVEKDRCTLMENFMRLNNI